MHHSPVAILQKQRHGREYRGSSSLSQSGGGQLGTSAGTTPQSYSNSFIDHAFDHPTPTSFSQLGFLSSSVQSNASNDGSDYTHRVPKVEEKFCSGFNCCGLELDDLHHLLEHFEECHVLAGPVDPTQPLPLNPNHSAFDTATASSAADMPQFDDFDEEVAQAQTARNGGVPSGRQILTAGNANATLSAPPSPAMSSYSDHHPANNPNSTLYELKTKRRNQHSHPSAANSVSARKGKSRSPPSDEEAVSVTSEDESGHLPFTRRARQPSVDSVASVSTNASTASKKRSFGAAMAPTGNPAGNSNIPQRGRSGVIGIDLSQIRGITPSAISTPDSSLPGTPASEANDMNMIGNGCLPPSLLYPLARSSPEEEDGMTTDDDSESNFSFDRDSSHDFDEEEGDMTTFAEDGGHETKRTKTNKKHNNKKQYDPNTDAAAAAMFSPLSLLGNAQASSSNSHINVNGQNGAGLQPPSSNDPSGSGSASPNAQQMQSAATLAAIQAAAEANAFPDASTPTGRIWVPNNAKPFKCPVPGCDKAYKQQNGLKYHRLHGHCNSNAVGREGEILEEKEEDKPFGCYVGPACGKKYKNMNGLRYHYQHSGAHGQIGLQMLSNGTHPPPAYPPGHKRAATNKPIGHSMGEFSSNPSPTVVMNQSTAEALLAAISSNGPPLTAAGGAPSSRPGSRAGTPSIMTPTHSRGSSPSRGQQRSPSRSGSNHNVSIPPSHTYNVTSIPLSG